MTGVPLALQHTTAEKFLIAHVRPPAGSQVHGRFISTDGTLGPSFPIDTSPARSNDGLLVAFTGTTYLVVWGDQNAATDWDVLAQAVTSTGTVLGSPTTVTNVAGIQIARGLVATGPDFLVSWYDGPTDQRGTKARFLSGTAALLGSEKTLFSPSPEYSSVIGAISTQAPGGYLSIVNRKGTSWDLYGKVLSLTP